MTALQGFDVAHAARLLREGGVVGFATETVYGLGADAFNTGAVARVFEVKNRPEFDPLIVHVSERSWLARLTDDVCPTAERLFDRFWPGPLTVVVPKLAAVPDLVTSGLPTVAVRMPEHPQALELIEAAGTPIAAPSANPFGRISPTRAEHVSDQLGDRIDYVLDGGPCRVGVESTVVRIENGEVIVLRHGGVTVEEIEETIRRSVREQTSQVDDSAASPGRLAQHYAPTTSLEIVDNPMSWAQQNGVADGRKRAGLLTFKPIPDSSRFAAVEVLSKSGDLTEATANLFSALRRLDVADVEVIAAQAFPAVGLGRALNDRIQRAAH